MMSETDEQRLERRLEHEARTTFLGRLRQDHSTDSARVEVTYGHEVRLGVLDQHSGYFLVDVHSPNPEGMSDDEAMAAHPATIATELVHEELNRRFPDADYLSVDDVYAA